jgi:transposase-like protein
MLREAKVTLVQEGMKVGEIYRNLWVSEQSYYRWRREYVGLNTSQAKRMKELKRENTRLKKAVVELTLCKLMLREAIKGY